MYHLGVPLYCGRTIVISLETLFFVQCSPTWPTVPRLSPNNNFSLQSSPPDSIIPIPPKMSVSFVVEADSGMGRGYFVVVNMSYNYC